jgi:hypothetical protein
MWVLRLERSSRKVEAVEEIVALGMMVSLSMRAIRPRCEEETMSSPRADLSSWDAEVVG